MKKSVAVLGATGSIGRQTLEVADRLPDQLHIASLAAGKNWQMLAEAALRYRPEIVAVADEAAYGPLKEALSGSGMQVMAGEEGLQAAATCASCETVLAAISGMAGLKPLLAAIDAGKDIALANKEALVAGGELVIRRVREKGVRLSPVDSEHSAIWQCLTGEDMASVNRLILTASGGAFRDLPAEALATVTAADALKHPNWAMGAKITVDCASMVNKGLEVIEAHWLFDIPYEKIQVLVHPQSIIHSMVGFADGSVKAQLGWADMRLPIQYALLDQTRPATEEKPLDLAAIGKLEFREPDHVRFPALSTMVQAGTAGGTAAAYLNGANEALVAAFLAGNIPFTAIADTLEKLLSGYANQPGDCLEQIFRADRQGRADAAACLV